MAKFFHESSNHILILGTWRFRLIARGEKSERVLAFIRKKEKTLTHLELKSASPRRRNPLFCYYFGGCLGGLSLRGVIKY